MRSSGAVFCNKNRDGDILREPQYLLCFNHIPRLRAGPFSTLEATFLRGCARGLPFYPLLGGPGAKCDAQGGTRVAPRHPKGRPGTTKKRQKIDLGRFRGAGVLPGGLEGTPRPENDPKIVRNLAWARRAGRRKFAIVAPLQTATRRRERRRGGTALAGRTRA